jgi:hypothetical protein
VTFISELLRSLQSAESQEELAKFIGDHLRIEDDRLVVYYGQVEIELTEEEIYFKNRYFRVSLSALYAAGMPNERVMNLD